MKTKMKKVLALLLALSLVLVSFGDLAKVKADTGNQEITLTSLHGEAKITDTAIELWINFSGGTWSDWVDWQMTWEPFVYEFNGVQKKVSTVQSAGANLLYVTIPISDIPATAGTRITIKAGDYAAQSGTSTGMCVTNDFEVVLTGDEPVLASQYDVVEVGNATVIHGTADQIQFSLNDKSGKAFTFGYHTAEAWNKHFLTPVNKDGNRCAGSGEWETLKSGVFQNDSAINYWPDGGYNFQEINNGVFYIGGLSATEGTVVTIKGAFALSDGSSWAILGDKYFIFEEFSFTFTNGTWVFSRPYQDVTLTGLHGNTSSDDNQVTLWITFSGGTWTDWNDWADYWYPFVYEIDGVKKQVSTVQSAGANLLYVTIPTSDVPITAGTKISIKAGDYAAKSGISTGLCVTSDFEIVMTGDKPVLASQYDVVEAGSATVIHGTADQIQFSLKDKTGNAFTFGYHTTEAWNKCFLTPVNKDGNRCAGSSEWNELNSGVFQDDSAINYWPDGGYNFQEINNGVFYIGGLSATEGTVVTIKGAFALSDGSSWALLGDKYFIFKEFSFTYTNNSWVSSLVPPEPSYTEHTGTPVFESINGTDGFYFTAGETEFPYDATNGSVVATAAEDEESGVFLNGEKTSVNLKKVDQDRWYVCLGDAGIVLEDGDEITIVGSFIYQTHKITFAEYTYVYEEPAQNYTGTPVLSETEEYGKAAGFYFTSEDGAPYAENWSLDFTALDGDENGVLVNDTKTAINLKKVGSNLWYVCIGDANVTLNYGDVVTIKGAFQVGDTSDTVTFNEASFEFNGKHFGEGEFTATDFTITGLAYSDIVYDEANSRWNMYFTLSTNIPGDVDATYYPYMTYELNGTECTTHWFKSSSAHTVDGETIYNLYIPIKELPQTLDKEYVITVKAGASQGRVSGTNVAREDGIRLTEDYQFTVGGNYEASAPTIDYLSANGGDENGIYLSSQDLFPTIGWDYNLTKVATEDGIVVNGEPTDVFIKKYEDNKYYVCLSDSGITATKGTIVMIRGAFTTAGLNKVTFKTAKYIFTNGQWDVYSTTVEVETTGVDGDAIGNSDLNSADLIRIKRYLKGLENEIGVVDADLNGTGNIDEKDAVLERKLLIGLIDENGAHIKGAPTYSDTTEEMRLAAYVSPTVAEGFDDYKAAGFTTLISENRAVYGEEGFEDYMNLAAEKGLDVLVQSGNMQGMFDGSVTFDQNFLTHMYSELSQYESFRGMYMGDEPVITQLENYKNVANALKTLDPNMDLFTSCHPLYAPDEAYFSSDTSLDLYEKYTNYAKAYGDVLNEFSYDFYPFRYKKCTFLGITTSEDRYMRSDWFNNLTIAATTARGLYDTSITVQSYAEEVNAKDHYRDVTEADISFQVYSALAYGMKSINYFTYGEHWESAVGTTNCMVYNGEKTSIYTAVRNVNEEIKELDHMLLNYTWQGTIGIAVNNGDGLFNYADYYDYTSKRISTYSATNDAIIGCLRDVDGYDGFMLVNATDPYDNKTTTVSVTFNSADHAKVFIGGVEKDVELTNGVYETTLAPGQGVFVIPYME